MHVGHVVVYCPTIMHAAGFLGQETGAIPTLVKRSGTQLSYSTDSLTAACQSCYTAKIIAT